MFEQNWVGLAVKKCAFYHKLKARVSSRRNCGSYRGWQNCSLNSACELPTLLHFTWETKEKKMLLIISWLCNGNLGISGAIFRLHIFIHGKNRMWGKIGSIGRSFDILTLVVPDPQSIVNLEVVLSVILHNYHI